jgi:hypothetical protein
MGKRNKIMSKQQTPSAASLEDIFAALLSTLRRLAKTVWSIEPHARQLQEAADQLEALPLSCDEFGIACSRLQNAKRYIQAGERGAARWELDQLHKAAAHWNRTEAPGISRGQHA